MALAAPGFAPPLHATALGWRSRSWPHYPAARRARAWRHVAVHTLRPVGETACRPRSRRMSARDFTTYWPPCRASIKLCRPTPRCLILTSRHRCSASLASFELHWPPSQPPCPIWPSTVTSSTAGMPAQSRPWIPRRHCLAGQPTQSRRSAAVHPVGPVRPPGSCAGRSANQLAMRPGDRSVTGLRTSSPSST